MDRSEVIYGNQISKKIVKKAVKSKQRFQKKFGDDSENSYYYQVEKNEILYDRLGICNLVLEEEAIRGNKTTAIDETRGLIVSNIRMGFGHYRISMAIASAANAMGYTPYWMDLNSYQQTTGGKVIGYQNQLYSKGSRLSAKSKLFNKFIWEPMNYEGFRKLDYNAKDQKNAELMSVLFDQLPKHMPVVATHVWPAQGAIHGGMKNVVNAVPDNWPMALHLAEGSIHTVQTHYAYMGYRTLNGMNKNQVLHPMSGTDITYTGHYVDHELVSNIEKDCEYRIHRVKAKKAMRFLLTIGGAGAQKEIFAVIIKELLPAIKEKKAVLYINVGDYKNVWVDLCREIPELENAKTHFNNWKESMAFAEGALEGEVEGIHGFYHSNIFEAVYITNLLMRSADVLVTKPSELSFYPIPKLFIKRVGGHEQWGAIHSAEIGDGSLECGDIPHTIAMLRMFLEDRNLLLTMCERIMENKKMGIYDGAYKVVELATKKGEGQDGNRDEKTY